MRLRLIAVIVGVVALVLLVHDVPLAGHLRQVERDRLVTKLERDAFILAGRSEEALEEGGAADDPTLARLVADYSRIEDVRVVVTDADANGVVGSEAERTIDVDFGSRPEIQRALEGVSNSGERASETLGENLFFVAVPVLSGDEVVGAVRFSAPERVVSERAGQRVRQLFVVAAISIGIAAAVAWLLSLMITRPLEQLRRATQRLAAGDLSSRAETEDGPPELRELGSSFDTMAERLEQLVERQRSFAGTASHQLRTPLTALRLRLEQLESQLANDPRAERQIEAAIAECDRLHRMIEGLLALSRAEGAEVGCEATDLSSIVEQRGEHWQALAEERRVRIDVRINSRRRVRSLPGAAEQIIDNLVDNALEASPPGQPVELVVSDASDGRTEVELQVIDHGSGLGDDDRVVAFDRFWRGPDADVGGSGLGLAVVAQLATACGGSARLDRTPTGGITAVVTFAADDP